MLLASSIGQLEEALERIDRCLRELAVTAVNSSLFPANHELILIRILDDKPMIELNIGYDFNSFLLGIGIGCS